MACPNCNGRSTQTLLETDGFARGTQKCNTCETVFVQGGTILKEGKEVLTEVKPKTSFF